MSFELTKDGLRSTAAAATQQGKRYTSLMWVERIEVYGFQSEANLPKQVLVGGERAVEFQYDAASDRLVLRKPQVLVTDDWELRFVYDQALSDRRRGPSCRGSLLKFSNQIKSLQVSHHMHISPAGQRRLATEPVQLRSGCV